MYFWQANNLIGIKSAVPYEAGKRYRYWFSTIAMLAKNGFRFFTLFTITVAGVLAFLGFKPEPTPAARLEAEREIFAVLLADESYADGSVFPIAEYTTLGYFEEQNSTGSFPFSFGGMSKLKRETVFSFREINKQSSPIGNYLPANIEVSPINISKNQTTWWISFSRAGFNSSLTQALVLKEEHLDCHDGNCSYGTGYLFFLQKLDNEWIVKDQFMYWRSHPT